MFKNNSRAILVTQEEAGVAVTEEAVAAGQSVVVNRSPIVLADKGAHQQQQCALRLVEVSNHTTDDAVAEAWRNHQLRACHKVVEAVTVQMVDEALQRFARRQVGLLNVRRPLRHLLLPRVQVVEALEGAHASGTHGDDRPRCGGEFGNEVTRHAD